MRDLVLLLLFLCFSMVLANKLGYYDYSVFKIVPKTEQQLKLLREIKNKISEYDFWNPPYAVGKPVLIMVSPDYKDDLESFIKNNQLSAKITIPNLHRLIDDEDQKIHDMRMVFGRGLTWRAYNNLTEINEWLEDQEGNDNFKVKRVRVGKTWEKRSIYGITITSEGKKRPGVLIEAGMHAIEWIAPAALTWVVNQILQVEDKNSIWHNFNYLFIPVANPDGYDYSHNHNRMWRKSRKPYVTKNYHPCMGGDLNRNWAAHWMEVGASDDPCDSDFAGSHPFSEIETKSMAEYYKTHDKYDIFLSFHSFSQYIMFPYSHTARRAPLYDLWERVGKAAAKEIKAVHNVTFQVGSVYDTIYPASGSSMEWYYKEFNSTLTYTFELRDEGTLGFMLPPDQIIPSGQEIKAALERMLKEYLKL